MSLDQVYRQAPDFRLPLAHVKVIGQQVLRALDYIHGKGVIHADTKAANFVFDKVLDPSDFDAQGLIKIDAISIKGR